MKPSHADGVSWLCENWHVLQMKGAQIRDDQQLFITHTHKHTHKHTHTHTHTNTHDNEPFFYLYQFHPILYY